MKRSSQRVLFFVPLLASMLPTVAKACPICMGGADTAVAPAMNGAIFLMLGLVGLMLSSAGGFIFYLSKRARSSQTGLDSMQEGKQHA